MTEQKLKKIGPRERTAIALSTSTSRRARENYERELQRRAGPAACAHCGAEPCGVLWTRPGDPEPGGARCCDQCTHEPVDGWLHTHTAWGGGQAFPVCALVLREGETVYLRRDGTVQFLELRAPVPGQELGGEHETDVPTVALLGSGRRGMSLYFAGEGGDRAIDLWQNQRELDPLWLPVRLQGAVARDDARKERRRQEREAADRAHDEKVERIIAEEKAKRDADIAKRQLKHEERIVIDEMELGEDGELPRATISEAPEATEPPEAPEAPDGARLVRHILAEGPDHQTLCGRNAREVRLFEGVEATQAAEAPECCKHCGRCARPELYAPPEEPPRRLTSEELKRPAAPKATGGRLKRSARQRRALGRQKLAWARQEAKNRLEVKRLERLARSQSRNLVEEKGAGTVSGSRFPPKT